MSDARSRRVRSRHSAVFANTSARRIGRIRTLCAVASPRRRRRRARYTAVPGRRPSSAARRARRTSPPSSPRHSTAPGTRTASPEADPPMTRRALSWQATQPPWWGEGDDRRAEALRPVVTPPYTRRQQAHLDERLAPPLQTTGASAASRGTTPRPLGALTRELSASSVLDIWPGRSGMGERTMVAGWLLLDGRPFGTRAGWGVRGNCPSSARFHSSGLAVTAA